MQNTNLIIKIKKYRNFEFMNLSKNNKIDKETQLEKLLA